jgi:hypothetical protein
MKLACIVLAHRGPEQLGLLLSTLRHSAVQVYLHLDSGAARALFSQTLARASADGAVMLQRRRSRWGGPEVVDAVVEGISRGVRDGCGYFVLISGQDFPVRPVDEIVARLEAVRSTSYVEHWPIPTPRWRYGGRDRIEFYSYNVLGRRETCRPAGEDTSSLSARGRTLNAVLRLRASVQPPRRFPSYAQPVGGVVWWNLTLHAARYILTFLDQHPDYRRYHEYTLCPDEIFFHTILLGTDFSREADVVNDTLRFMDWEPGTTHPRVLEVADLPEILKSEDLFARKFDLDADRDVLVRLLEYVV